MNSPLDFENSPVTKKRCRRQFNSNYSNSTGVENNFTIKIPQNLAHSRRYLRLYESGDSLQQLIFKSGDFNSFSISFGGKNHFKRQRIVKGDFSLQQYARKSLASNNDISQQLDKRSFKYSRQRKIVSLRKRDVSENLLLDRFPDKGKMDCRQQ